jgi:hypothetical protein
MSLILDALKKLDREESSRRRGMTNIATEILKPDISPGGGRLPRYLAAVFLAAIATVVITYAVMVKFGGESKKLLPAASSLPVPSRQGASGLPAQEPFRGIQAERSPVSPQKQNPAARTNRGTPKNEKEAIRNVTSGEAGIASRDTEKPIDHVSREAMMTPPSLKISGIIWSEEPSERRAVINGMVTREGAMIEGMKVMVIYPNHVRFSYNGRLIEISMSH